jgi:nitrate reductase gamma subunit
MSTRSREFHVGLILAIFGYTTMILTAATGVNSTIYVWATQTGVILFVLGVVIMLLTATKN